MLELVAMTPAVKHADIREVEHASMVTKTCYRIVKSGDTHMIDICIYEAITREIYRKIKVKMGSILATATH